MLSPVKTQIERFSNRVDFYERYRPGYPDAALDVLCDVLRPDSVVADVGSGTGISSRWLLQRVLRVYAVEPNDAMRERSQEQAGLVNVNGTAEATGLADASVDAVVCATAFHWFDVDAARREFARILRPRGNVVLLWNIRKRAASSLQEGYEKLIAEFATDYQPAWDHNSSTLVDQFFADTTCERVVVPNQQILDWDGWCGRAMSASYMPLEGDSRHAALIDRLRILFEESQRNGVIRFEYDTTIYWGGASSSNR